MLLGSPVKDPFESSKQVERSGLEIGLKSVNEACRCE
jgi:hypothetical protein